MHWNIASSEGTHSDTELKHDLHPKSWSGSEFSDETKLIGLDLGLVLNYSGCVLLF